MDKKTCQTCGKKFRRGKYDVPSRWEQRKICSQACRVAWNKGLSIDDPRVRKSIENLKKHSYKPGSTSGHKLTTPSAPGATPTGLTGSTVTYRYRLSALNDVGETAASTTATATVGTDRDSWDPATQYVTLTWKC